MYHVVRDIGLKYTFDPLRLSDVIGGNDDDVEERKGRNIAKGGVGESSKPMQPSPDSS